MDHFPAMMTKHYPQHEHMTHLDRSDETTWTCCSTPSAWSETSLLFNAVHMFRQTFRVIKCVWNCENMLYWILIVIISISIFFVHPRLLSNHSMAIILAKHLAKDSCLQWPFNGLSGNNGGRMTDFRIKHKGTKSSQTWGPTKIRDKHCTWPANTTIYTDSIHDEAKFSRQISHVVTLEVPTLSGEWGVTGKPPSLPGQGLQQPFDSQFRYLNWM